MSIHEKMTAIATAIREKTGGTEALTLDQMATEIAGLEIGSGSSDLVKGIIERSATEIGDSTITAIANYAFVQYSALTSVNFPNATSIGTESFNRCTGLTDVTFPAVVTIADYAWRNCTKLAAIKFPKVTTVNKYAFLSCTALASVYFPHVTRLGTNVFESCSALITADFPVVGTINSQTFRNCSAFRVLILRNEDAIVTLGNTNAFDGSPFASGGTGGTVYVPQALIEAYQAATNWSVLYAAGSLVFSPIEGSDYE